MKPLDYSTLNPGIRRTVQWLREHGYETTDSGDGVTNVGVIEGALEFPHVVIQVHPRNLVDEADRLMGDLWEAGVCIEPQGVDPSTPCIQATYDPGSSSTGIIMLMGVSDRVFFEEEDNE